MPKKLKNVYDKYLTYENLLIAHKKSRKCKGRKDEIILFNLKQEEYIKWLYMQLKTGNYRHGGYSAFYVSEPKKRRVEKARYIDRVVHRFVVDNFLLPLYEPQFINTSYACLKNKGAHKAALKVQNSMRKCKINWGNYYILKTDVSKFFMSINKDILMGILQRKIADEKVLWLIREILYKQPRSKGLEIGNYTSQTFANIYLNELDQFVKHNLHVKHYFRYMDDCVFLLKNKEEAKNTLKIVTEFLKNKLDLELNSKTQIFKNSQGVNFCGYKINEYRIKLRDMGKRRLKVKVKNLEKKLKNGEITSKDAQKFLAGHNGYIKIADTYNLEKKLFPLCQELGLFS